MASVLLCGFILQLADERRGRVDQERNDDNEKHGDGHAADNQPIQSGKEYHPSSLLFCGGRGTADGRGRIGRIAGYMLTSETSSKIFGGNVMPLIRRRS